MYGKHLPANEGVSDVLAHKEPAARAVAPCTHEDGEHGQHLGIDVGRSKWRSRLKCDQPMAVEWELAPISRPLAGVWHDKSPSILGATVAVWLSSADSACALAILHEVMKRAGMTR